MIASGFATPEFLRFASPVMSPFNASGLASSAEAGRLFPYFIHQRSNGLLPFASNYLVSPICFSGCARFDFKEEFVRGELAGLEISGGFLQSREPRSQESGFYSSGDFFYYLDSRSNYRLEPGLSEQAWLKSMKRDSRSRVRKILTAAGQFELLKVETELEQGDQDFFQALCGYGATGSIRLSISFQ